MSRFHLFLTGLAVVQIVLILVLGGDGDAVTEGADNTGFRPLPDIAASEIGEIDIRNDDGERVHVLKKGDAWTLANRGGYPVRASQVEATAKALRKLYAVRKLTDDPARHHTLEVKDDHFHLHVVVKDTQGETIDDFYLGEQGGPGSLVYRKASDSTAWAATGPDSWDFEPSTSAWIETRYVNLTKGDVTKVELLRKADSLVLVAREEEEKPTTEPKPGEPEPEPTKKTVWYAIVDGKETATDASKVSSLLGSLTSLYMAEPIGTELKPEYGLTDPTATARITMKDGKVHTMQVGKKRDGDQNDWYFKSSTSDFVVTIRDYTVTDYFQKKTEDVLPEPKKPEDAPKPGDDPDKDDGK